jgi:hypothetical protein
VFCLSFFHVAWSKPLDHGVYDSWQSIGEYLISPDGKWVVYTITSQEGDGELLVQNLAAKRTLKLPRGSEPALAEDSKFLVFKIKPPYQVLRQAKIKKKKADEMPKHSLGILELGQESPVRIPRVKSFKLPAKEVGYLVYHKDKPLADTSKKAGKDSPAKMDGQESACYPQRQNLGPRTGRTKAIEGLTFGYQKTGRFD